MGAVKAVKAVSKVLVRVNGVVALDMRVHRRVRAKRALLASFYKAQKVTSMLDYAASRNAKKMDGCPSPNQQRLVSVWHLCKALPP